MKIRKAKMIGNFYEFGSFRILPVTRQLRRDGQPVLLTDREFDTLHAIVRHLGEPVSRDVLLNEVWHDVNANVDPNNLSRQIANLRRKMGRDETGDHYICTITGQGYYVPGVSVHSEPSQPVDTSSQSSTATPVIPTEGRPQHGLTFRRLPTMMAAAACATALGLAALFGRFQPREIRVTAYRPLTNDGRRKIGPLVTDGQRVFFTEQMAGKWVIASISIAGGDVSILDLPVASPTLLDISRERNSLLLTSDDDGRSRLLEWQLRSRSLREVPRPAHISEIGAASWHSSGNRMAVASKDELTVFSPSSPTEALRLRLPGFVGIPRWDRESNRWRFDVYDGKAGRNSWWELTGDDRSPHPIPVLSGIPRETEGSWADHDRYYIFQVFAPGHSDLWLAEGKGAATTRAQRLTNGPLSWDSPVASSNSQTIFAVGIHARGELSRLGRSKGGAEALLGGLPAYELDYSRDGQWVVFTRYPEHTIWRCRPDATGAQQLTPHDVEAHQPHWSPDGTRIAFMGKRAGSQIPWRIYIVPAPGGTLDEPLPEGDDQGVPTWSADGQFLIFGDRRVSAGFDHASIHKVDLRTRAVSAIREPVGLWSPRMSPDGKYLVAVSYDSRSLFVRDNLSATWKKLIGMEFIEEPAWSPDSSWIHFSGRPRSDRKALFRIQPASGHAEETADVTGFENLGEAWFGVAPDGSPLGFRGTITYEVYALDWQRR